eukprot:GHVU01171609.1.p1 GENE.GHVU01171609.1~~GHVU01171609.1.p1  ORF type:complete len:793 (-),score=117.48 GHVU01171609.1:426-2525(-)
MESAISPKPRAANWRGKVAVKIIQGNRIWSENGRTVPKASVAIWYGVELKSTRVIQSTVPEWKECLEWNHDESTKDTFEMNVRLYDLTMRGEDAMLGNVKLALNPYQVTTTQILEYGSTSRGTRAVSIQVKFHPTEETYKELRDTRETVNEGLLWTPLPRDERAALELAPQRAREEPREDAMEEGVKQEEEERKVYTLMITEGINITKRGYSCCVALQHSGYALTTPWSFPSTNPVWFTDFHFSQAETVDEETCPITLMIHTSKSREGTTIYTTIPSPHDLLWKSGESGTINLKEGRALKYRIKEDIAVRGNLRPSHQQREAEWPRTTMNVHGDEQAGRKATEEEDTRGIILLEPVRLTGLYNKEDDVVGFTEMRIRWRGITTTIEGDGGTYEAQMSGHKPERCEPQEEFTWPYRPPGAWSLPYDSERDKGNNIRIQLIIPSIMGGTTMSGGEAVAVVPKTREERRQELKFLGAPDKIERNLTIDITRLKKKESDEEDRQARGAGEAAWEAILNSNPITKEARTLAREHRIEKDTWRKEGTQKERLLKARAHSADTGLAALELSKAEDCLVMWTKKERKHTPGTPTHDECLKEIRMANSWIRKAREELERKLRTPSPLVSENVRSSRAKKEGTMGEPHEEPMGDVQTQRPSSRSGLAGSSLFRAPLCKNRSSSRTAVLAAFLGGYYSAQPSPDQVNGAW